MSHYQFITIAPLTLQWPDMVELRRTVRREWDHVAFDPSVTITKSGAGSRVIDETDFAEFASSRNIALDAADLFARDHYCWIPFVTANQAAFDEFCASAGVSGSFDSHVLLGRSGSLLLVTAYDFPETSGLLPFNQRAIRRVQEKIFCDSAAYAALQAFVQMYVLRPFLRNRNVQIGAPRMDSTHTVTLLVGGSAEECLAMTRVHAEEEGSDASLVDTLGLVPEDVPYVRFGWSYSTVILARHSKELVFANLMLHLQSLWYTQRTLREQLDSFRYETSGIRKDRALAVELEALNIERTYAHNEVDNIRAHLQPWLRETYDYVYKNWVIGETSDNIERMIADLRAYYERKLDVFENRQSKRQANVLFWIALLQMVALYEGVGAYFSFLDMSEVDTQSIFHSAYVATAVIGSPIMLTAVCLYAAYLYFRDDR